MSDATPRHERTKEIFLAAIQLDVARRPEFLEEACGGDAGLRLEVEELLLGHVSSDDFLKTPILGEERSLMDLIGVDAEVMEIPEHVGEYRVLERLGTGGMGIVYLARQESPRREVALKVIRPALISPRALKRFEYEAELLGRLSHEGIARVYEAGTASSGEELVPYFAMEFVEGASLLEHARKSKLDVPAKIELVIQVAEAVHHAHQKGVVHRDLKPVNILVTPEGQPKILDFGVARATDGDLKASRPETAAGQLLGTVSYMSPEQASGDSSRLDARADVYALGVIAFELLTGELPHELSGKSLPEATRWITEHPPRRLRSVKSELPRDLDLVLHVALDPDPGRRYPSAHALASDLRRWLRHEPVSARPASLLYLLRKFVRRNRVGVGAFLVASLGLLGWAYGMWRARTGEHEAELARRTAESEAQGAREMFDIWLATFDKQAPGEGVTIPMLESLEETIAGLETSYEDRPELAGELHLTIGYTFLRFGEFDKALDRIQRGVAAYTRAFGENHEETLNARVNMANAHAGMRDAEAAISLLREVRARALEHLGPEHRVTIFSAGRLGSMLAMAGELREARAITEEALEVQIEHFGEDDLNTLSSRYTLAGLLRREGEFELALSQVDSVVAAFPADELFLPPPGLKWGAQAAKARILSHMDRTSEALAIQSELVDGQAALYGDHDHPSVLLARESVAQLKAELGLLEEAISETRELRAISVEGRGERHVDSMRLGHALARLLFRTGEDDDEGEELLTRIVELGDGGGRPGADVVDYNLLLGRHLMRKGRYEEARPRFYRALEVADLVFPEGSRVHARIQEHIDRLDELPVSAED